MLTIIPFQKHSGIDNMSIDIDLFNKLEQGQIGPTFRLYGWQKPCISLGYSQKPEKELYLDNCGKCGIEVVKRPTGGGIVFHNEYELTYSLVCDKDDRRLPKGLISSYKAISDYIIDALKATGVPAELSNIRHNRQARLCFSFPASYEITLKGHKIVGSAQKRGKKALLQQGSIFIRNNGLKASDLVKNGADFKAIEDILGLNLDRDALVHSLVSTFSTF